MPAPPPAAVTPAPVELTRGAVTGIDWIDAPATGDVAGQVSAAWQLAQRDNRVLLVYVGAKWCEPCQLFHDTVKTGRLDTQLAGLRLLAYDLDRDKDRLALAGYTSDMIPLFAGTTPDGMATQRKLAGAVKGAEAIGFIVPKLTRLLNGQRRFDLRLKLEREERLAMPLPATATSPSVR